MDYQNRIGSKKGSGGVASQQDIQLAQKKRINQLFDVSNDPYFTKNHVGQYECKLCHTLHISNDSYLNHVNGRKHQLNVLKRSKYDKERNNNDNLDGDRAGTETLIKNDYQKIGKPSYKTLKIRDPETSELGLFLQVHVDKMDEDSEPFYRFMTCFEYEKDTTKDSNFQYLLVHARPYDIISFKIPSKEINFDKFWTHYDKDIKQYYIQFVYKNGEDGQEEEAEIQQS